ncbi:MAG: hypothetical protein KA118_13565 [Verrucomicrobia bacterium]|nr:hypothetical protein [Verrucomicrobiota bacterium]
MFRRIFSGAVASPVFISKEILHNDCYERITSASFFGPFLPAKPEEAVSAPLQKRPAFIMAQTPFAMDGPTNDHINPDGGYNYPVLDGRVHLVASGPPLPPITRRPQQSGALQEYACDIEVLRDCDSDVVREAFGGAFSCLL